MNTILCVMVGLGLGVIKLHLNVCMSRKKTIVILNFYHPLEFGLAII